MAEQTIRVNVPDGYEVVAIDVPKAGIDYVLCGDDVILAPATVYSRVIVRKVDAAADNTKLHRDNPKLPDELTNRERKAFERYYLLDNKSKSRFSYHPQVQVSLQGAYKDYHIERAWRVWLNRAMLDIDHTSRAAALRDKVMQTWDPPRKMRENEAIATVAQTATMQTIAWIMGPEFMGQLDRNQQQAIDSGMLFFRAAFEDAKA